MHRERTRLRRVAFLAGVLAALAGLSRAETLPVRTYTSVDGLPSNQAEGVFADSQGFLWVVTPDGLSRFDGHDFVNLGVEDGLPPEGVTDLLETRSGTMWVSTWSGLYRFDRSAGPFASAFTRCGTESGEIVDDVSVAFEDRAGTVWVGTADAGFYRLEAGAGACRLVRERAVSAAIPPFGGAVRAVLDEADGSLWIGAGSGLLRRRPDGSVERFGRREGLPSEDIRDIVRDRTGQIWLGTAAGVATLVSDPEPGRTIVSRVYTTADGLGFDAQFDMLVTRDGALWVSTLEGVSLFVPGADPARPAFRTYSVAHGLSDRRASSLCEDLEGNLWMATESAGVTRLARHGFTSFGLADGLADTRIGSVLEDRAGELIVVSGPGNAYLNRFDGSRFTAVRPDLPAPMRNASGWGIHQITFQDHTGDWWIPTGAGVVRLPAVRAFEDLGRVAPKAVYSGNEGLRPEDAFRLFEDSRGDVWVATITPGGGLHRWDRKSERLERYSAAEAVPDEAATAFAEDTGGAVWIGFYARGIGRLRGGRLRLFTPSEGAPNDFVFSLFRDHRGRIWAATESQGLFRVDHPETEDPIFRRYSTEEGLSSNHVRCVTEDAWGRIYAAGTLGVDRLDPDTGRVKHFTTADGIANTVFQSCVKDRHGNLWFGSVQGLSRLVPTPDPPLQHPPAVWIRGVRVAGAPQPMPKLGAEALGDLRLDPAQRRIEIDFAGLSLAVGGPLRYQYLLEGAGREWSAPSGSRSVDFANLSSGRYRFLVRAVTPEGLVSPAPARVEFVVLRPVWQRSWFVTLLGAVVMGAAVGLHRQRLRRLLEVERVRTRIATDLHDDLGLSLSRISILSEVAKRSIERPSDESAALLTEIGDSARGLIDATSDIVWSIDPRQDNLGSLIARLRKFASDVFESRGIRWAFEAPEQPDKISLSAESRRHLYLALKEAVTNIVKHAGASAVSVSIAVAQGVLVAEVRDDGRGFVPPDPAKAGEGPASGNGLRNMRSRAETAGGRLEITSAPGSGTRLTLTLPLR